MIPKSSRRIITVVTADRNRNRTDMYLVERLGREEEDPYVRPGTRIVVESAGRRVGLRGAVHEPGTYELLPSESLKDLLYRLTQGPAPGADLESVAVLSRSGGAEEEIMKSRGSFDLSDGDYPRLDDGDVVHIPARKPR